MAVALSPADRIYLARARELAMRGIGNTAPNPPVGAVIARDDVTLGEGWHRVRGGPHAEVEALDDLRRRGHDPRGATLYVTLEPCNHFGATPPCAEAVVEAGLGRVVIGWPDPNPKTAGTGIGRLRAAGIAVELAEDINIEKMIEPFAVTVRSLRPYVTLKMAASLDGYVAPRPGTSRLSGSAARERVRELRIAHDAVMVGAGTIRIDNPQLTVRPIHARRRSYVRIVACETAVPDARSVVFARPEQAGAFRRTIVLAPGGRRARFEEIERIAECIFVGGAAAQELDLHAALIALREAGVESVLCEGGPTLAAGLLRAGLVDRLVWFVAPILLRSPMAVPALAGDVSSSVVWRFEELERSGDDLLLSARVWTAV